jgi:hypothetical protein
MLRHSHQQLDFHQPIPQCPGLSPLLVLLLVLVLVLVLLLLLLLQCQS